MYVIMLDVRWCKRGGVSPSFWGFGAPFEALGNQRSGDFTGDGCDASTCRQVRPKSRESKSGTLTRGKSMQAKPLKPGETLWKKDKQRTKLVTKFGKLMN